MAITQDAFGNTFAGNYLAGDAWNPTALLTLMRTALGSNDRANMNSTGVSNSKYEWRPNIVAETKTGAIAVPTDTRIVSVTGTSFTLPATSRLAFAISNSLGGGVNGTYLLDTGSSFISPFPNNGSSPIPTFTSNASFWAIGRVDSISLFIRESSNFLFLSTGFLQNSGLAFPGNRYGFTYTTPATPRVLASTAQASMTSMFASTAVANYAHIQKSDEQPTTDEVELYLRRQSDNAQLGFVPNVFKVKIEAPNTAPAIGDIVRLDLAEAQSGSFYFNQGNIFCIVVGRLGNTSETDLTGDYLLMRVAG